MQGSCCRRILFSWILSIWVCRIHPWCFWSSLSSYPLPLFGFIFWKSNKRYQVCFGKAHPALFQQKTRTYLLRVLFKSADFLQISQLWSDLEARLGQCHYFSRPLNRQTVFWERGFCGIVTCHCPLMPCIHVRARNVCEYAHIHTRF